jgi:hypothetical protein
MFRFWKMSGINWSEISMSVWAISDNLQHNQYRRKYWVCKVKLLKTEVQLLQFEASAISKIQIQAAWQHHAYSLYGQHYFVKQCIIKLFRPMWHIYFSVVGQFWVYFMVICLFHNLYFINSAQWKTSVLHLRGSCIYLHDWLADGIFSL